MNKSTPSKKILKQLCKISYKRELDYHLGKLKQKFDEWQNNTIDCWDLKEFIHQFHDGVSRDIYQLYNYTKDDLFLVSRAASLGFLEQSEIPVGVPIKSDRWEMIGD